MQKNYSIEGLRGVLVIFIVLYHMIARYSQIFRGGNVKNYLLINNWGAIFVPVFLIVSSYFLFNNRESNFKLSRYYTLKIVRLWPSYFISISIIFFVVNYVDLPGRTSTFWEYICNIFWVNGFIGINYVDGAHWYLTTLVSLILVTGIFKRLHIDKACFSYLIWLFILMFSFFMSLKTNGLPHLLVAGTYNLLGGGILV